VANADKIKAELARTEASRQTFWRQANTQANKLIERLRGRPVQEAGDAKALPAAWDRSLRRMRAAGQYRERMLTELRPKWDPVFTLQPRFGKFSRRTNRSFLRRTSANLQLDFLAY